MTSVESVLGNRTNWTNAERYRMEGQTDERCRYNAMRSAMRYAQRVARRVRSQPLNPRPLTLSGGETMAAAYTDWWTLVLSRGRT